MSIEAKGETQLGCYVWYVRVPELEPKRIIDCFDEFMVNSGCVPAYTLAQFSKRQGLRDPYVYNPSTGFKEISWDSRLEHLEALQEGEELTFGLYWREQNPYLVFFDQEYLGESTGADQLKKWLDEWPRIGPLRTLSDSIIFGLKPPPAEQITIFTSLAFNTAVDQFEFVTEYLGFVLREELGATSIKVTNSVSGNILYSFHR